MEINDTRPEFGPEKAIEKIFEIWKDLNPESALEMEIGELYVSVFFPNGNRITHEIKNFVAEMVLETIFVKNFYVENTILIPYVSEESINEHILEIIDIL